MFTSGAASVAYAAPFVPYASIFAYPDNPTSVSAPSAVVVAPNNDVIVADAGNHRIRVLLPTGALLASWGTKGSATGRFSSPRAVALGPDNLVYVADTGNNRIQVFERNGTFRRTWGTLGTADGQMSSPSGVAVGADGRVYVTDSVNARIQVFSATGGFLEKWGSRGGNADQFELPWGIAVDSSNYVYVVDTNKQHVKKFNPTNRALFTKWGWTGQDPDVSRYSNPRGISLVGGTSLIVADTGNNRIERCSLTGSAVTGSVVESTGVSPPSALRGRFDNPWGATMAADGSWVVADTGNDRIQHRDTLGVWQTPWATPSADVGLLALPEAIAADPDSGVTYVADTQNSRVLRYSATGSYLGSIAESGTAAGSVLKPAGVLVLLDGSVMVADTGNNRLQRFASDGAYLQTIGAGQLSGPRGMDESVLDTLYVADTGNNRVAVFTPVDGVYTYASQLGLGTGAGDGQFSAPRGVALVGTNYLWVADTGNHRIQKFNTSGTFLVKVGSKGSAPGLFNVPSGVMTEDNDVVVADTANHRIQRFDAQGNLIATFDGSDTIAGSMNAPVALSAAPGARTLVLERGGCRVQVLVRDNVAPVTTVSGVPATPVREATLTFSAVDPDGSGIAATYIREGGVARLAAPLVLNTEGIHTVSYWSVDVIGNIESEETTQVTIDRTPPVGAFQVAGGSAATSATSVAVSSAVGGASQMRFAVDAAPTTGGWGDYASVTNVGLPPVDGPHTVYAEYRDIAGNVLTLDRGITLDRVGPALSHLSSPTHASGVPTWGEVRIALDAADPAGIAGFAVSDDADENGTPPLDVVTAATSYTLQIPTGERFVHAMALDNAGNWGPVETLRVNVLADNDPPSTTASGTLPGAFTSADVTITLSATDAISGPAGIVYRRDGSAEQTYTGPLSFTDEGAHTVSFHAIDKAGISEAERSLKFTIDRTGPTVAPPTFPHTQPPGKLRVEWAPGTDVSGVEGYAVVDDTNATTVPNEVVTTSQTVYEFSRPRPDEVRYVHIRAKDRAGNWGEVLLFDASPKQDTTPPTTTATGIPAAPARADVTVTLSATDDLFGVSGTYYRIGSGTQQAYTGPFLVTGNAILAYWSEDAAGNREAEKSARIDIDRRASLRMGRPVVNGRSMSGRIRLSVSGVAPAGGAGRVRLMLERRVGGVWVRQPGSDQTVSVAGANPPSYRTTMTPPVTPVKGSLWRVRAMWSGSSTYKPAVSAPSLQVLAR